MSDKQNGLSARGLPTILCECGQEILVIPDLKEMILCIDAHANIHKEKELDLEKGKKEFERIEQMLAEKVLIKVSKMQEKKEV